MAKYKYQCWKCRFKFWGHDVVAQRRDNQCPRCGVGARKIIFTPAQKRRGILIEDPSSGLVVRLGREREMLFVHGYYRAKQEHGSINDVEVLDAAIPEFG